MIDHALGTARLLGTRTTLLLLALTVALTLVVAATIGTALTALGAINPGALTEMAHWALQMNRFMFHY